MKKHNGREPHSMRERILAAQHQDELQSLAYESEGLERASARTMRRINKAIRTRKEQLKCL